MSWKIYLDLEFLPRSSQRAQRFLKVFLADLACLAVQTARTKIKLKGF
jgi:hypothetical protein